MQENGVTSRCWSSTTALALKSNRHGLQCKTLAVADGNSSKQSQKEYPIVSPGKSRMPVSVRLVLGLEYCSE